MRKKHQRWIQDWIFHMCSSHIVLINDWQTWRKYELIAVTFHPTYKLWLVLFQEKGLEIQLMSSNNQNNIKLLFKRVNANIWKKKSHPVCHYVNPCILFPQRNIWTCGDCSTSSYTVFKCQWIGFTTDPSAYPQHKSDFWSLFFVAMVSSGSLKLI